MQTGCLVEGGIEEGDVVRTSVIEYDSLIECVLFNTSGRPLAAIPREWRSAAYETNQLQTISKPSSLHHLNSGIVVRNVHRDSK